MQGQQTVGCIPFRSTVIIQFLDAYRQFCVLPTVPYFSYLNLQPNSNMHFGSWAYTIGHVCRCHRVEF